MPILFPIAFVSLVVLYVLETYMLYYSFKIPITYDEVLHGAVLKYLSVASIIAFAFNFW
jgi:hypothetical protein